LFCLSRFVLLALPDVQEHVEEPVPQTADPVIITHKAGDEKSQAFWRMLGQRRSGDGVGGKGYGELCLSIDCN
jgi:hypothetical protein